MKKILPYSAKLSKWFIRTPLRSLSSESKTGRWKVGGFTLVELLVVVAIIAILTAIGVTVFTNVQKSARDARRTGDIDAIASALEASYNPGLGTYSSLTGANFSSGKVPLDPLNSTTYVYTIYTSNSSDGGTPGAGIIAVTSVSFNSGAPNPKYFIVCAMTEDLSKANSGNNDSMSAITPTDTTVYYCRRSQQG